MSLKPGAISTLDLKELESAAAFSAAAGEDASDLE